MDILEIEVNGQFIDLYPDEKIVQSLSVLNITDITKRYSEYSNQFKVTRTNTNSQIIEYADFVTSETNFPFSKNPCTIYINGFQWKQGYLQLVEINEDINLRFYTGNIGFYNKIKPRKLNELVLSTLDHNWNLTNAIASRLNSEGYIYPLIDYNGVSTTGISYDVRRCLAAYYDSTLMKAICEENGYTLVNNLSGASLTEYNSGIVPSTKKNPQIPQDILDDNKYIGGEVPVEGGLSFVYFNIFQNSNLGYSTNGNIPLRFPYYNTSEGANENLYGIGNIGSGGSNYGNGIFTAAFGGIYKITTDFYLDYYFTENWTSSPPKTTNVYLSVEIEVNGVLVQNIATNNFSTSVTFPTSYNFSTYVNNNSDIYLNVGDQVRIVYYANHSTTVGSFSGAVSLSVGSYVQMFQAPQTRTALQIELQPDLNFGAEIKASYLLPEISQGDYFKDTCLRYCLIPSINEDTKVVTLTQFNDIKNNIGNSEDWSALVDETKEPSITFDLSEYAQRNNIKHKEDTSILTEVIGSDYVIALNNRNLEDKKDLYISPFAASEDVTRLGTNEMIFIDLHDGTYFTKSVQPRRCYIEKVTSSIDYTDGTTTTNVTTSIPLTWFIRSDKNFNMGFGNNQMSRYSSDLINILQNLRIIKIDIKLTLIDILNLNYFYPVYLSQYNAYFFVSSVNQFDYTSNDSTEVELIKLL